MRDDAKFTPDKWNVVIDRDQESGCIKSVKVEPNICTMYVDGILVRTLYLAKRNAALIAAAPEMYSLLEYLAEFIEQGGSVDEMREINLECIKATLKKARGEE